MEEYTFTSKEIVIHWYIRLHSRLISRRDNRALFKQFTTSLHLDKLEKEDLSYQLPKSYPIATNEIIRLYDIRNKIIMGIHEKEFVPKQKFIDDKISELENEYDMLKSRRNDEKKEYDRLQAKFKHVKNSEDHISLEARISKAEATLINTDTAIKNCNNQIKVLKHTKITNRASWKKQIKSVEKTIELQINNYIKMSTKKIELTYGFTNFEHDIKEYDEEIRKIINGDYQDEKTA